MSMTDPIADMLTRIRNAQHARHAQVLMPASKIKKSLAQVLKDEGYIADFRILGELPKLTLEVDLKYHAGKPVIDRVARVSKPGRRVYSPSKQLPKILGGLGVAIISTSQGLMSDRAARKQGIGGEVLCEIA